MSLFKRRYDEPVVVVVEVKRNPQNPAVKSCPVVRVWIAIPVGADDVVAPTPIGKISM